MKIHLKQIRDDGLDLEEALTGEQVGLTPEDSISFSEPVAVKLHLTRIDNEVFVHVGAASRTHSICDRCLEPLDRDWSARFDLAFEVERQTEFLEIGEDVRQELILNLPQRQLCQEDCKGLCIDCGVNLNKEKCEHEHAVI